MITATMSALVIDLSVLITDQFSIFLVPTFESLLSQAVSMRTNFSPLNSSFVSTLSLVVPLISFTITLSFPTRALTILDFPTFGFPIIASFIPSTFSSPSSSSGNHSFLRKSATAFFTSLIPLL
jgi:hypothetical protein